MNIKGKEAPNWTVAAWSVNRLLFLFILQSRSNCLFLTYPRQTPHKVSKNSPKPHNIKHENGTWRFKKLSFPLTCEF